MTTRRASHAALIFLFLAGLTWPVFSVVGVAEAETLSLTGHGSEGYKKKRDAMPAREAAIDKALKDAVLRSVTGLLSSETLEDRRFEIESRLLPTASVLVQRYEIVNETNRDKVYEVVLEVWVDVDAVERNLESLGIERDVGKRRTIAVLIEEYVQSDEPVLDAPLLSKEVDVHTIDAGLEHTIDAEASTTASGASSTDARVDIDESGSYQGSAHVYGTGHGHAVGGAASESVRYRDDSSARYQDSDEFAYESGGTYDEDLAARYSEVNVTVREYFPPEALRRPRPNPVSAAAIGAELKDRDAMLVDANQLLEIRDSLVGDGGVLLSEVPHSDLAQAALELGRKHSFDAMMAGVTVITRDTDSERSGSYRASATLAVRIVDTATGEITATQVQTEHGKGTTFAEASDVAAKRLGSRIGKDLGDQLFDHWRRRAEKGVEVTLRVHAPGMSTRQKFALLEALLGAEGAKSVEERSFDQANGLVEFRITSKLETALLRISVFGALSSVPGFDNIQERMSLGLNWNYALP